ncbi:unnamed protein product [Rotaria socialis]|uniref:Eukaryotic translation initiation factor 4E type 3 n=2 Tax=Rotaria socialis TaxID=392032 RepID=A0A818YRV5_9BILA|nr:unnamed protein product [Rotaria socialis]CAF3577433.1 unnamed protein product [Rotaria socialis]CAF3760442.1 unnamed protein product [Rotaria socialis]CAF4210807.1 unnamed protein product [Rotaria socialis]CAF4368035.1 unnamed protein product [Rotaria socialis]
MIDGGGGGDSEYSSASETFNDDNYVAETTTKIRKSLSLNKEKVAPLAMKWTFWLDSQKSKFASKDDYEAGLQKIFAVDTVQEFWSVFNNIPTPSRLANRVSYHLMRRSRKPLWEDRENENGGIYTYRCPKDKTNTVWQELCLAAIGEQFSVIEGDDVVGVSVQSRDGPQDLVQIWNSNPTEEAQKAIDEKVRGIFPDIVFQVKFYKANSSHANFEAGNQQKSKYSS